MIYLIGPHAWAQRVRRDRELGPSECRHVTHAHQLAGIRAQRGDKALYPAVRTLDQQDAVRVAVQRGFDCEAVAA